MAGIRIEVDDRDAATTKRRGDGPVRRTQLGHSALDAQPVGWQSRPDDVDEKRNAPSHHALLLRHIDARESPGTDLQGVPLVEAALVRLLVASLDFQVWFAVLAKAALSRLHVATYSVPIWLTMHTSQGWSRWVPASWSGSLCQTRWCLTSWSGLPCQWKRCSEGCSRTVLATPV